mmetsp:Transcript_74697/g.200059  ORF Transcript_74697/g.200059 Transcript_74697/m.200059 type:complete len:1216 (+) Transcript_74697:161-3808(+)
MIETLFFGGELLLLALSTTAHDSRFAGWWQCILVFAIVLLNAIADKDSAEGNIVEKFISALGKAFVLRFSIVASLLFHELAHLVAAASMKNELSQSLLSTRNFLGNVDVLSWVIALVPFFPWPASACNPFVELVREPSKDSYRFIRLAGPIASISLAAFAAISAILGPNSSTANLFALGSWMVAGGALASDVFSHNIVDTKFYCGNFGMMVICALDRLGVQVPDILREMAGTTAARGGQAGGLVTLLPDGSGHRTRYVPFKRADVADGLIDRFFTGLYFSKMSAALFSSSTAHCRMFLGHTRFATSSKPSTNESHPHRFSYPRKVRMWRAGANGWSSSVERYELYVTHNGDFDYWPLFGRMRTQGEIGLWLKKILGATHEIAGCDSVKVAGVMELLRTQGVWEYSFRLAYQLVTTPSFEETIAGKNGQIAGPIRAAAAIADHVFGDFVKSSELSEPEHVRALATKLVEALYGARAQLELQIFSLQPVLERLVLKAIANFLEGDLYNALVRFLGDAEGSFGITACCSLDQSLMCIASRGQAMCVSFCPEAGAILWGSESATQLVPVITSKAPERRQTSDVEQPRAKDSVLRCTHRHDLDENGGEIIEVAIYPGDQNGRLRMEAAARASARLCADLGGEDRITARFQPFTATESLYLRVFRKVDGGMVPRDNFLKSDSLISLESDLVDPPPPRRGLKVDRVEADLRDIPRVLELVRADWKSENGRNRRTAAEFYRLLQEQLQERAQEQDQGNGGRLEVDVLVTGVEASLWIGEQFASDLQTLFPSLRVLPISSNKIIGVLSNHRGSAPMAGFAFSSLTLSLKKAIVVSISHSGQTFPTLHATHALRKVCGNRLFVLTGAIDSKMASAVGQSCYPGAPWIGRVWYTFSGWRPSEALTVSTVSCHQTLSELLLFLAKKASRADDLFRLRTGFKLTASDVSDFARLNESIITEGAPSLVGYNSAGEPLAESQAPKLRAQGRRWALHILETPWAWILSTMYIFGTIIGGSPLFSAIRRRGWIDSIEPSGQDALTYICLILDSILYSFLPLFFSIILRIIQGRPLTARLGKRTIVIGDVPYVNQLIESYVSKMFAESYSIASVECHGANAVDHLVHRFTHRVVRGLLIAVGRPDGRLFSLTKAESWVLMSLQQCKSIVHLLSPPEIITVGHNPYHNTKVIDSHIALERRRPKFFCEVRTLVMNTPHHHISQLIFQFDHTSYF